MQFIKAIFLSVFNPKKLAKETIERYIFKYGFILIFIRWAYYTIVFSFFRNYKNDWTPFVKPPFGLTIETYSFLQSRFALLFGFFLMFALAYGLFLQIKMRKKAQISFFNILNILGFAYFIPFIVLQPLDKLAISYFGWIPMIIVPLHTIVLIWESTAVIIMIDIVCPLKLIDKIIGILLQIIVWISICAILWR